MDFPEIVKLVVDKGKKNFYWCDDFSFHFYYYLGGITIDWIYWNHVYVGDHEELKLQIYRHDQNPIEADFNDIESLAKATIYINNNHLLDDYIN